MWNFQWREDLWHNLDQNWDLLIIGGGITGAGILRLASARGIRALLVEAQDFSFGTSSRSSKMVHGGFRYLYNRQFDMTRESAREREWLIRHAPNLVTPLSFLLPVYQRYGHPNRYFNLGVSVYDILAQKWAHQSLSREQILNGYPYINSDGLLGGQRYIDAVVDDSRLVLRVIQEAAADGGQALNYARVVDLLRRADGLVCGVRLRDESSFEERITEVHARVVVNATGPWTDELRGFLDSPSRLRKQRGSHLVFARGRFPVNHAVTLFHPQDKRAMFVVPWEGGTLVGTTDLDHPQELEKKHAEPFATQEEIEYILQAVHTLYPDLALTGADIISSFAGLRPIVRSGAATPGKESRAHAIWEENGMITITGGKLTIFRIMAEQVLDLVQTRLSNQSQKSRHIQFFREPAEVEPLMDLPVETASYLIGRYGANACHLILAAHDDELLPVEPLPNLWAELRWAARSEAVHHLDDLLLRRVRLGLLLPGGGLGMIDRIKNIVQTELGWDNARWQAELARYQQIWANYYSPQPGSSADSFSR